MTIVGVIVAAGASTRMGRPKQLLEIGGRPLLQWVVDAAEASRLDQVVVVTGHAADEVRAAVTLGRSVWAHNPDPDRGTMSSFRAGLAVAAPADAVVKLVCDQPEVTSDLIDGVVGLWDAAIHRASLVAYEDGDGHPLLISAPPLAEIIDEDGDRLLWSVVAANPEHVGRFTARRLRPTDINTEEDLRMATIRLGYDPSPAPPIA
ncbi:MAG: nucleotidyltransferase family protein [Acidimicrobiia bacterium]|nr:nucleotidyltransferase family protein [Acidimicrobiia bacterium]NNL14747.1 nucleotidyltransferase family protein [Acidimicrobiia bacterium]